ncbi:tetratricopeptide repeat protein [Cellvibrio sp. pealriver]|uniref:tetratricopeptide repeat protein n=1 Tax=Cellvibrio sp. pealriver TaxID=1622269 RepID=UPI00066FF9C2|nr:tetratricopeptide repeat protein [Cellvibrio sp. pealriver]
MLKKAPSQTELNALIYAINSSDFTAAENMAASLSKAYPKSVIIWKILGVAIAEQGRYADAIVPMQKVITLDPKDAEAHRNMASILDQLDKTETAEIHFRKAISLNSQDPISNQLLGKLLNKKKNYVEAEKYSRKAIALQYDLADAHDQLGIALLGQQKQADAEASFNTAIMLNPMMADAYNNLGITQNEQGRYQEADANYRKAIELNPQHTNAYNNLATNFMHQHLILEAEAAYRMAVEVDPLNTMALSNWGRLLHLQGNQVHAKELLEKALEIKPDFPEALNNLGNVHKELGDHDTAIACYRKATDIDINALHAYSNLLLIGGYHAKIPLEQLIEDAKGYGKRVAQLAQTKYSRWLAPTPLKNDVKIRIGFVSGDLRKHAVMFFLEGLLRNIDKNQFELIAYSTQPEEDEVTHRIKSHFIKWQPIFGKSDQAAANIIYQDAVHILFDLSGHTAHNRLPVFAYKPAPIQVTWAGYPATTGMDEMDYILADKYLVPAGQEQQFVENVWRFPEVSGCFAPLIDDIPVGDLPALKNGYITFGCLNNLIKMNDDVVEVWSQVLHAVPNSKLFLQAYQLSEPSVLKKTYVRYAAHGIPPDRLILEGKTPRLDYFKSYNKIDIALDPFPCPGGTTTADTLWMSVPVLTLKGHDYWGRFGEAIANYVGQPEWVAQDKQDYVRKAAHFAADIDLLKEMRQTLRTKALASPLFDAPRFTRNFESVLKGMLEKWQKDNS